MFLIVISGFFVAVNAQVIQIVGGSSTSSGDSHAFFWDKVNGMQILGTLGGNSSVAYKISDPVPIPITIDIKPRSDSNCFNQDEKGVIPVAILGSADLDVTQINIESLALQGLSVKMAGKSNNYLAHYNYLNGDDYLDLIVQFQDSDGWIASGNGYAAVTGELNDSTPIEGKDTICIVP